VQGCHARPTVSRLTLDQRIAFASVVAVAVVSTASAIVTAYTCWRDRASVQNLALEERRQQRLADAYVELLQMAEQAG